MQLYKESVYLNIEILIRNYKAVNYNLSDHMNVISWTSFVLTNCCFIVDIKYLFY